jgi:hypothetical protein
MIRIYNIESGDFIGSINEEQFEFLMEKLEEESNIKENYYIDSNTIEYLTDSGADEELIDLLVKALGEDEGVEISIEEEESSITK